MHSIKYLIISFWLTSVIQMIRSGSLFSSLACACKSPRHIPFPLRIHFMYSHHTLQCEVHMPKVHEYSSAWICFPLMKRQCTLSSTKHIVRNAKATFFNNKQHFSSVKEKRNNNLKLKRFFFFILIFSSFFLEILNSWRGENVLAFLILMYKYNVRHSHFSLCV